MIVCMERCEHSYSTAVNVVLVVEVVALVFLRLTVHHTLLAAKRNLETLDSGWRGYRFSSLLGDKGMGGA